MIKRTRIKFFAVTASIITIMLSAFCLIILLSTYASDQKNADYALQLAINNIKGTKPMPYADKYVRLNDIRTFAVLILPDQQIATDFTSLQFFSAEEILTYVNDILATGDNKGKIGSLRFLTVSAPEGKIIAAIDLSIETERFNHLLVTVLLSTVAAVCVLLAITWFLSYWIIRPAAASIEKQKRFISEAGHELKTPLTIIFAGIELIKKQSPNIDGEAEKWLNAITTQAERLKSMTTDLLTLAKLDERASKDTATELDLTKAVLTETLFFEAVAFEQSKKIEWDIQEGVCCKASERPAREAVAILLDNAIKHSPISSTIKISLKKVGSRAILRVSNPCNLLKQEELPLLFERFYRASDSRAEAEGSGLGLAILKALADNNGFKTSAQLKDGTITLCIVF